ncbi:MAG TPA: hypothetical protein VEX39_16680 [Thermoleophilaceae bacterium]|nr:hypothetical protein [Thermoleophilaceae bacterium]
MSQSSRLRIGIAIATVVTAFCVAASASAKPPATTYRSTLAPQIATVDAGGGSLNKLVRTLLGRTRYRGKNLTSKAEKRIMKSLTQNPSRRLAKKRIQNYYCYQWYYYFGRVSTWSTWRRTNTWAGWSYRYCQWVVRYRPIWNYLYG